ncbi:MAG TPA: pyruvate carboxyltransferase [Thermodesulforhabdus norvegica]|uniref:Pyruvate carboxyltransferase n=1 Tax=Thermodesulforhabdus norvegica TaxID=39841 RepID=A0A7C1AXR9_9BACT|nr:pyruvate carboxyltransferase [Deltaproteobacteria bacterium]MBW2067821.1 pyruvate carboxyltransferase [Deltaproteobacteria bacterium]HDL89696.1 pyruvate carboxyltransferase [Thermodesulforhabdus norvegica]
MPQLQYPKKVVLGDITVRDGFQHEEKFFSTDAKLWVLEESILAGFKRLEVTNFGNPKRMPQFKDADELFKRLRNSKRVKHLLDDVELTAITIRERAIERAINARKEGYGPDRVLVMVSTSESHQKVNSGIGIEEYFKMCEEWFPKIKDVGMKICGTVSTIWGCPIEGPTDMRKAVEFTKRWLDMGADDVEHADHDGSAPPNKVYEYFSMVLDAIPDPTKHVAHFHVTRGWGLANVLAALLAGITHFEGTYGGIGGQPANFVDDTPVGGTGEYYYRDPSIVGLVCMEDMVVMMDEMGIDTGVDVDHVLRIGRMVERIVGRRLRSECVRTGRIPKEMTGRK